jgi:hypothetical protein
MRRTRTVSVPPEIANVMDSYPDVNWSHVATQAFVFHINSFNMKPELRILTDAAELRAAALNLTDRQRQKLSSHKDAVIAQRPDGTIIVYRPTQK